MSDIIKDPSTLNDDADTVTLALERLSKIVYYLVVAVSILAVAFVCVVWYAIHKPPVPIGIDPHGHAIPLLPLDVAHYSDARVASTAEETLRVSFAHDFENYGLTVTEVSDRYTPDGFDSFKNQLAPFIKQMKDKRYVMSASIDKPAIVVDGWAKDGVYVWKVQARIILNRVGQNDRMTPTPFVVTMMMQQVPLDENIAGIATASVDLTPAG